MQASVHYVYCLLASLQLFNLASGFILFTIAPAGPCIDKDKNCPYYAGNICTDPNYGPYAKDNCAAHCKFCLPVVTAAPACVDALPNCAAYGTSFCSDNNYRKWRDDNCRKFCGICSTGGGGIPTKRPNVPTKAPVCVDKISDCYSYGTDVCGIPSYNEWVNTNCKKWCNRC